MTSEAMEAGEKGLRFDQSVVDNTEAGAAGLSIDQSEVDNTEASGAEIVRDHEDRSKEDNTDLSTNMTAAEAEQDRADRESWLTRFPSGYPPFPTTTPEEAAYWAKAFEDREAEMAKQGEIQRVLELSRDVQDQKMTSSESESEDEDMSESASMSARPAAIPKASGRCTEGNFCGDLLAHSCIYDTKSTVSNRSTGKTSVKCYGLSREGEERPNTQPPHQIFTIEDLNLVVDGHNDDTPSIVWTNASVLSTLASVIETDPSVVSTLPSVISTTPSVQVVEEVDPMLLQCQCGTRISIQERVATMEYSRMFPAPYVCRECRWRSVGL